MQSRADTELLLLQGLPFVCTTAPCFCEGLTRMQHYSGVNFEHLFCVKPCTEVLKPTPSLAA